MASSGRLLKLGCVTRGKSQEFKSGQLHWECCGGGGGDIAILTSKSLSFEAFLQAVVSRCSF